MFFFDEKDVKPKSLEIPEFGDEEGVKMKPKAQARFHELVVGQPLPNQMWCDIVNYSMIFQTTPQGYSYWAGLAFHGRNLTEDDLYLLCGLFEIPYGKEVEEKDII